MPPLLTVTPYKCTCPVYKCVLKSIKVVLPPELWSVSCAPVYLMKLNTIMLLPFELDDLINKDVRVITVYVAIYPVVSQLVLCPGLSVGCWDN